jgi:hypothetical protein
MTWAEIQNAVQQAGISDNDEIVEIHCEPNDGGKTLHQIRLGRFIKLAEDISEKGREAARGCCV